MTNKNSNGARSRNNKQIVIEINALSSPSTGATPNNPGKNSANNVDSLRRGKLPKAEKVVDAKEVPGAHKRAVDAQVGANGNPHVRDEATWGISRESLKTAKKLK